MTKILPMYNDSMNIPERVRRLNPKRDTLRRLFALSQNQCAFENCRHPVIDQFGTLVAEVCHIEAANEGGERFNKNQSNEDRRQFENLIVLCRNHHGETDNVDLFPTMRMKQMKANHEAKTFVQGMAVNPTQEDRFVDQSTINSLQLPTNLRQLDLSDLSDSFFPDVCKLMEAVAGLPNLTRSLYANALAYSNAKPHDLSLYYDPLELAQRLGKTYKDLEPHFTILDGHGLLWFPEYRHDWSTAGWDNTSTPGTRSYFRQFDREDNGIYFLCLVRNRFLQEREILVDIFENLNFHLLDA